MHRNFLIRRIDRRRPPCGAGRYSLSIERFESRNLLDASFVISEFLASNDNDVEDVDRERPDWIEVLNTGDATGSLDGWYLTDDSERLTKWKFPDVSLAPGKRVVVFASGKDRTDPAAQLHANFRLAAGGEYLALVQPDGMNVAFDFGSAYPPQLPDVSFGMPESVDRLVHAPGQSVRMRVPVDDSLGMSWTEADFDDSAWSERVSGIGYNSRFADLFKTDVQADVRGVNSSVYLRIPFDVEHAEAVFSLKLTLLYNDGFVVFVNGVEAARPNAPESLAWNSKSVESRDSGSSREALLLDLSAFTALLRTGRNVIAIQGLNNDKNSSNFLLVPELEVLSTSGIQLDAQHYFAHPTARGGNGQGTTVGLTGADHSPRVPDGGQPLQVTVSARATRGEVPALTLHYRVMWDAESSLPMFDDGLHGDGSAGDAIYGAAIPGGVALPGQMIRYRITAGVEGDESFARLPIFADPVSRQEYFGTVVADLSVQSRLQVFHLFVENVLASERAVGSRGALFYNGQFYDNIEVDSTGRTTLTLNAAKKSHDLFFPEDHWFELEYEGQTFRMDDFDLMSDYLFRDKVRVPLAYGAFTDIGTPSHLAFPIRVERNGEFFGTYWFGDGGNERFLERAGLDAAGALYKMNLGFSAQGGFKKQTRKFENTSDLEAFFAGLGLSGEARTRFLMDNVNIPATLNFLAGLVLVADIDCCQKNLYFYRDTEGTGEWEPLPYDMDLTFSPHLAAPSVDGLLNSLFIALFQDVPDFRSMYFRRVRSVLDQFLGSPESPVEQRYFENRIRQMAADLEADADRDFSKYGIATTLADQLASFENYLLARRRVYVYGLVGDMDHNGQVDMDDIDDLVSAIRDPSGYFAQYGEASAIRGDTDLDGDLDFDDLAKFAELVQGGPQPSLPLPAPQAPTADIAFDRIESSPESGNQDEEFIELVNPGASAVDLSGWSLEGGVSMTFPAGTVLRAGGSLFVSPDVVTFRKRTTGPSGNQGLLVVGNYGGHLSREGETVRLRNDGGTMIATVSVAAASA